MISLGVNTHSADQVSMYPAGTPPEKKAKKDSKNEAVTDTFTMAAASEKLAGKRAQEGVKSLNSNDDDTTEFSKEEEKPKVESKPLKEEKPEKGVLKEQETKEHKVIVETKSEKEKLITEVMPMAKPTEKKDLEKPDQATTSVT